MGIFYTQPPQILTEYDLSYIQNEILVEGFNPYQSIKKFFAILIQKIKDFFAKIFSKSPKEKETSGEPIAQPTVKKPVRVPQNVIKARSDLKLEQANLRSLHDHMVKLPTSLPLTMSYFDADKGLHVLMDGIHDVQKTCSDELEEVAHEMDKMIQRGEQASFYYISKNKFLNERAKKGVKNIRQDIRNLVKIKSMTVDVSKIEGLYVFDTNEHFTKPADYEKQITSTVVKATERIESELNSLIRKYDWLQEKEELMSFQTHVSHVINDFSYLVKAFQAMFSEKNNALAIQSERAIVAYNEDKREWLTDQEKVKQCEERIKVLEDYLSKNDQYVDEV